MSENKDGFEKVLAEVKELNLDADRINHNMLLHAVHDRMKADGIMITQAQLWKHFNAALDDVVKALDAGKTVKIERLIEFKTVDRSARNARNPRTGEVIHVPAKRVIKIIPKSRIRALTKVVE